MVEPRRILVVNDADFLRSKISDILTNGGYIVVGEAANGQEAVEKFYQLKPDLVLMDLIMPTKSGIEALRDIRNIDVSAKVVMHGPYEMTDLFLEAIEAGANDFFVLPFRDEDLLVLLGKVFE